MGVQGPVQRALSCDNVLADDSQRAVVQVKRDPPERPVGKDQRSAGACRHAPNAREKDVMLLTDEVVAYLAVEYRQRVADQRHVINPVDDRDSRELVVPSAREPSGQVVLSFR